MALRLAVDAELLAVNYLRAHVEISALVATRVTTELPPTPTFPALTVTRIGGLAEHPGWIDVARLQVDAWGINKAGASRLARTALAALREMPGTHASGFVSHVAETLGLIWSPDDETDQPRYLFGVALYTHPLFA